MSELGDLAALAELHALAGAAGAPRRGLTDGERRARIDFAGAARDVQVVADAMLRRHLADRTAWRELLRSFAAAPQAPNASAVDARRLMLAMTRHGLVILPGVAELLDRAAEFHRRALIGARALGRGTVVAEARAQGLTVPADRGRLAEGDDEDLALRARAAAEVPIAELAAAVRQAALNMPVTGFRYGTFIDAVLEATGGLSERGLATDHSRVPAQQAWGLGRLAEAAELARTAGEPAEIYASELMDENTCSACEGIDARRFATRADADALYPTGTYRDCEGGPRCRGTVVWIWSTESRPSVP